MINGIDIYYSNVGQGLKPIGNKKTASGVSCKKYGKGLKILQ